MAHKATIYKAAVSIADMDRNYYADHTLTLAQHPSETEERLMARLLAFILHADEELVFAKGLSSEDEPDLWHKDLTGDIDLWIDVGLPDERRLRKACGRAGQVIVYAYGGRSVDIWWQKNRKALRRTDNLRVINLAADSTAGLAVLLNRTMQWQCTIEDGQLWLSDQNARVEIVMEDLPLA